MIELTFHGAARSVTGSCHLLEINGNRILLDCGLFQGHRSDAMEHNISFPFDPASIDMLILSHAHIDHAGRIPLLVRRGFTGPIYSTYATRDLAHIMLMDSAHIQEKDAEFLNKKHAKRHLPAVEPLYTMEDALLAMEQFQSVGYRRPLTLGDGITLTLFDAGHILGSAFTVLDLRDDGRSIRLCFTGDVGRPDRPILRDPDLVGDVDVLISESTYGGRYHPESEKALDKLETILATTVSRGGKIIVPAFSIGRTQELVYDLHQLSIQGRIPKIPMYVDSPLSVNATEVFRLHPECMDPDIRTEILSRRDPFGFTNLHYVSEVEESKSLNDRDDPMMIIASSGMCEAGRILHHLANGIENERNTILITGYSAENTLGRRLVEKEPVVRIFGDEYRLRADVQVMNSLSAHADRKELMDLIGRFDRNRLERIFLVHGDEDQQRKLQSALLDDLHFKSVDIPEFGAHYSL